MMTRQQRSAVAVAIGLVVAVLAGGAIGRATAPTKTKMVASPLARAATATPPTVKLWTWVDNSNVVHGMATTRPTTPAAKQVLSSNWDVYVPPSPTTTTAPVVTTTPPTTATTSTSTTTTQPGQAFSFSDDFNGSSVDTSKWNQTWYGGVGPVNGSETACYSPAQNSVSGGNLAMTAVASGACGKSYATGFVDTQGKFSFTTGTLEFRAFLPGDGTTVYNWPALWTDGEAKPPWPANGESDTMEGLSGHATCTYHSPVGAQGCNVKGTSGWHTYGEVVTPGKVIYYYDGTPVGTVQNPTVGNHPHFLIMSNQMGQYGGPVVTPTTMLVDYVHVTKVS